MVYVGTGSVWTPGWEGRKEESPVVGLQCRHDEGVERAEVLLMESFPMLLQKRDKGHGRGFPVKLTIRGQWVLKGLLVGDQVLPFASTNHGFSELTPLPGLLGYVGSGWMRAAAERPVGEMVPQLS